MQSAAIPAISTVEKPQVAKQAARVGSLEDPASFGLRFVGALVVVALLCGPRLSKLLLFDTLNRHQIHDRDIYYVISMILLAALVCVSFGALVRRIAWPLLTRALDHIFVLALGAGVLTNLWYHTKRPPGEAGYQMEQFGMEIQTAWLLLIAVVAYSFAKPACKLVLRCRQSCMILFPGVLIIAWQLIGQQTIYSPPESVPAAASGAAHLEEQTKPIYLFVFDEWSYDRSFEGGKLKPAFKNLSRLARQSVVFHQAHSQNGWATDRSMPGLIFQTDLPVSYAKDTGEGRLLFERDGRQVSSRQFDSIFSTVGDGTYDSFLVGFSMGYRGWLGDSVDVYRTYPYFSHIRGPDLPSNLLIQTYKVTQYWTDPWTRFLRHRLKRRVEDLQILWVHDALQHDILEIIANHPRNSLMLFHLPMPHLPGITDGQGNYLGVARKGYSPVGEEAYARNLSYTDKLIGDFVGAINRSGDFDEALIIITSDHSWRADPKWKSGEFKSPLTHVPLFIKFPGQQHQVVVEEKLEARRLGALMDSAIKTDRAAEHIDDILRPLLVPDVGAQLSTAAGVLSHKAVRANAITSN